MPAHEKAKETEELTQINETQEMIQHLKKISMRNFK